MGRQGEKLFSPASSSQLAGTSPTLLGRAEPENSSKRGPKCFEENVFLGLGS